MLSHEANAAVITVRVARQVLIQLDAIASVHNTLAPAKAPPNGRERKIGKRRMAHAASRGGAA